MSLRRLAPFALAFGALACQPSLPGNTNPQYVDYAVFDPAVGAIPTPNDLVLGNAASVPGAQGELLRSFAANGCTGTATFPACGGWPSDQEVPIIVNFTRISVGGGASAPDLDVTKFKWCPGADCNATLLEVAATVGALPTPVDPARIKWDYTAGTSGGTLNIHHWDPAKSAYGPWNAGSRYIVALRAGDKGLKTVSGGTIQPQPTMWLLLQDKDLTDPANQSLLPGATAADRAAVGAQLETIRRIYAVPPAGSPLSIFGVVDSQFPHREIAALASFAIVGGTYVVVDPVSGVVPLPSDFLLDPTTGMEKVRLVDAFGALKDGIAKLDGFSTTGMITAQTSGDVRSASVAPTTDSNQSVFLFDLTGGTATPVYDLTAAMASPGSRTATYLTQPPPITFDTTAAPGTNCTFPYDPVKCTSPVIGLQPAIVAGPVPLPPLKERTDYGVVITRRVLDKNGKPLIRSTAAQILALTQPVFAAGKSQLATVDDAQAQFLEILRLRVAPVYSAIGGFGLSRADVALAYSFRTQSITGVLNVTDSTKPPGALQLAALPYDPATVNSITVLSTPAPLAPVFMTPGEAATVYGTAFPASNVQEFIDVHFPTVNILSTVNGAFDPANPQIEVLKALIAAPKAARVTARCGTTPCAPLVIFHHGLGRFRGDMLLIADALAAQGFVVAAVDSIKHGDRSYCTRNAECSSSGTCTPAGLGGIPLDPKGGCSTSLLKVRADCTNPDLTACTVDPAATDGLAAASSNYIFSQNLFRTRDSIRQDVIDQAALALAVARPAALTPLPNPLTDRLATGPGLGYAIDPTKVYWVGQSWGSILGTMNVAVNPRISRAVLNVGGGTLVGIGLDPDSALHSVFLSLAPADPAAFLSFVYVAKWVADPADPINFAGFVKTTKLPSLLPFIPTTPDRSVLGQAALCDNVVPNAENTLLAANIGLGPFFPQVPGPGTYQWYASGTSPGLACPANAASHGFLLDFAIPSLTVKAQTAAVSFLANPAAQPSPVWQ